MATLRREIAELAGWLEAFGDGGAGWAARDADGWLAWRRAVTVQGLAAHLAHGPVAEAAASLPATEVAWLREQDERNTERIRRLHADLARILGAAAARGLEVMPLKGSLLTTMPGEDPYRRPMADLDLLVRPADRAGASALLTELGWRPVPEHAPRPTHDTFVVGDGRVVDPVGEHAENPRRVDLHTEVKRHLWGWVDDDDLTPYLWAGATRSSVLGEPATVPTTAALFAHLAIHASSDLLVGRGRLVGWLDLGRLATRGAWPGDAPHPRVAYPALRLAARAQPTAMRGVDLAPLEAASVPPSLTRWAGAVPLDDRCGLSVGRPPDRPSSTRARWERWRPARWRLAVAYGDAPLPVGLARHGALVARRLRGR
jgi:hypothetical protein